MLLQKIHSRCKSKYNFLRQFCHFTSTVGIFYLSFSSQGKDKRLLSREEWTAGMLETLDEFCTVFKLKFNLGTWQNNSHSICLVCIIWLLGN